MSFPLIPPARPPRAAVTTMLLALLLLPVAAPLARAQVTGYPRIPVWAFPGAWQDNTLLFPNRCVGDLALRADSVRRQPRTVTVRWLRDRRAELRPDFGGYRVYRVTGHVDPATGQVDTARMVLLRRYSVNAGDSITWHFSRVDTTTLEYVCHNKVVNDSVLTYVDPDSSGAYYKVCRLTNPPNDPKGRCLSVGDSVFKLIAPPGPHDGFRTWYTVTYEAFNQLDNNYEDLYLPDTTGVIGPCFGPKPDSCFNLNNKMTSVIANAVEPTAGPTPDLERIAVVPNPYRATEAWDTQTGHEVHFINLPTRAKIQIYTVAGDLVAELKHDDPVRDFERWDLKNGSGRDVSSGIYVYRVVTDQFTFQHRFIVIR
jgi:hypothetical protein